MLEGQPTAGAHLRFGSFGQFEKEARGDQRALVRREDEGRIEVGAQVHAGVVLGGVGRERMVALVDDADRDVVHCCVDHWALRIRSGISAVETSRPNFFRRSPSSNFLSPVQSGMPR